MQYVLRIRGWEKWWSVALFAPPALLCLVFAIASIFSADGSLIVIALLNLALFGGIWWYCLAVGQTYHVTFTDDAVQFATVFRKGRMAKADIAAWSPGRRNSGWPVLIVLHSKTDPDLNVELPLIRSDQEVRAWFANIPMLEENAADR